MNNGNKDGIVFGAESAHPSQKVKQAARKSLKSLMRGNEMNFVFNSQISLGDSLPDFTQDQIKSEVMLFSADYHFAKQVAGPLTLAFLDALPEDWKEAKDLIIDSRVHMLMKDFFYPCIPGFHHDDVPRRASDGQPDYFNPAYRSEHVMALVNGNICPTRFALGEATFPDVEPGEVYYRVWHPMVEEKIKSGELISQDAVSNRLIFFNDRTWHEGVIAREDGWRWFIRASRQTHRKTTNEIRRQVQVYLQKPMAGW